MTVIHLTENELIILTIIYILFQALLLKIFCFSL